MSDLIVPPEPPKGLKQNHISDRYQEQGYVLGTFLQIPSPQVVELLGLAGFDFVVIDCEHAAINPETVEALIRAAAGTGVSPMVRVPRCDELDIRLPLDMGAAGVHVPQIHSAEMAKAAVRAAMFYPRGERGLHPYVRAGSYRDYPTTEFVQRANEDTVVVVHIEGTEGVGNFDAIAQVDGVDVAFVGPYDLSHSLGIPGMTTSPLVREKMNEIINRGQRRGMALGTFCDDVRTAMEWFKMGITYLTVGLDAHMLKSSAQRIVGQFKDSV